MFLLVNNEELAIDPMSIFIDPNLYRFCWIQLGPLVNHEIKGWEHKSKDKVSFQVSQDRDFQGNTYCIEYRNRNSLFIIPLQMTRLTDEPKILNFTVSFSKPLGPVLEIIRVQTVPTRVYIEMNTDFAGVSSEIGPLCHILIMSEAKKIKEFEILRINTQKRIFKTLKIQSTFSIYYTCTMLQFFSSSTKVVVKEGNLIYNDYTDDIQPFIQMPLKRFLLATWKHNENLERRYDVAIYERNLNLTYTCVKVFRIFVKIITKTKVHPNTYAELCDRDISIEDLGYFSPGGDGMLTTILDMVTPLIIYKKYKFEIFWKISNGTIKSNYIHFTPLPNENSGNINKNFFEFKLFDYNTIINEISSMDQTVLSQNNKNPYKYKNVRISRYVTINILSSVMLERMTSIRFEENITVSKLYKTYKDFEYNNGFFPYFYALYHKSIRNDTYSEIIQLPIPHDNSENIKKLKFIPDNKNQRFTVSWIISNHPNISSPALFGIEISYAEKKSCHEVYLIKCRTCNKIYLQDSLKNAKERITDWNNLCVMIKERNEYYDAIDSIITFNTDEMPPNVIFETRIFSFKNTFISESQMSDPTLIIVSFWQKYGNIIIGLISATIGVYLLTTLFCYCKKLCKDPEPIEKSPHEVKIFDEEIYDNDI